LGGVYDEKTDLAGLITYGRKRIASYSATANLRVAPRVCLERGPGKREHWCQFGIHLENLG
jgi:hypothetical protein